MSLLNLRTDASTWPIPCTTIKGPFTRESTEMMIDFLERLSHRGEDYVHMIVIENYSIDMKVMKQLGKWQFKNREVTAMHCRGSVVCVENTKGFQLVLNTLLNITPINYPIRVVSNKEDAISWAKEHLTSRICA